MNAQRLLDTARMLLKPNMVLPRLTCPKQETVDEVTGATVRCPLRFVPVAVPGLHFVGRPICGIGLGPFESHES